MVGSDCWRNRAREALTAGIMPKNSPTPAENPTPMPNDHQGIEIGKPLSQWTPAGTFAP